MTLLLGKLKIYVRIYALNAMVGITRSKVIFQNLRTDFRLISVSFTFQLRCAVAIANCARQPCGACASSLALLPKTAPRLAAQPKGSRLRNCYPAASAF